MPSETGPKHMPDDPPFRALQFISVEFESILQDLGVNKGSSPDGIPPIILKNCSSAFAKPLSLLFNRSLVTSVLIDLREVSYVTRIFKKGRRNNCEDYRDVAILFVILKRFKLLVYRGMCNDLKNPIPIKKHGFMKSRSTITNLILIEDGYQVDSVYTDFSMAFDRVRHQLLLEVCGYRARKMHVAEILSVRKNAENKNRWRSF
jgi:hypothetical protein